MNRIIKNPVTEACVIRIGDRYFCRFGKQKRVGTAWSLAGATLFLCDDRIDSVMDALIAKGKKPVIEMVELVKKLK